MDATPQRRPARLLIATALLTAAGCGQDADVLARISRKALAKLDAATHETAGQLTQHMNALPPVGTDPSPAERVALRLRWEQALAGADIQVLAADDAIELKGTVLNAEQRTLAATLAQSTLGVSLVVNSLTVPEPRP